MTESQNTPAVRVARVDDIAGISSVAHQTWRATYSGLIPNEDINAFLSSNYSLDRLAFIRDSMGDGMLVAASDDQVVGYVMVTKDRNGVAQIWAIYVLPGWQRKGVGSLLWEAAVNRARQLGSVELVLWVLAENTSARRFYERQGAIPAEERDFPVGGGSVSEVCYRINVV